MSDLVTFVRARLDEDEQVARNAERYPPGQNDGGVWHQVALLTPWDTRVDEHVARHDPARVLREVEAKRKALARHHRDPRGDCVGCGWSGDLDEGRTEADEECPELLDMATVWSDHPDYQAEWAP